jgi:hypothetical protein
MVWEKFSLRQKKLRGEVTDVFVYDRVPKALRAQICHLLARCLGDEVDEYSNLNQAYIALRQQIAEELGRFGIGNPNRRSQSSIFEFFVDEASDQEALDIIDLAFSDVVRFHDFKPRLVQFNVTESVQSAVATLNRRFLEHQLGYTFIVDGASPQLIRRDNEYLHKEAVLPALQLLHEQGFEGANDEYRNAHEHYRKGNHKECLNDCLKAFESTLKTICKRKKWTFDEKKDTASQLIEICVSNGLMPSFMTSHFGAVKSLLSSGVPTVRNKMGGHGQGETTVEVPAYYAEFLLNETAASIVFLVKAFKS